MKRRGWGAVVLAIAVILAVAVSPAFGPGNRISGQGVRQPDSTTARCWRLPGVCGGPCWIGTAIYCRQHSVGVGWRVLGRCGCAGKFRRDRLGHRRSTISSRAVGADGHPSRTPGAVSRPQPATSSGRTRRGLRSPPGRCFCLVPTSPSTGQVNDGSPARSRRPMTPIVARSETRGIVPLPTPLVNADRSARQRRSEFPAPSPMRSRSSARHSATMPTRTPTRALDHVPAC